MLLVNPKLPANTVKEFIALAKAAPDTIHYASSGNGSSQHLMGGMFVSMTGARLAHVPYRGSSGAATDLGRAWWKAVLRVCPTRWRRYPRAGCARWP